MEPEQFLLAAVDTCLLFTLRAIARASKLEFTSLEVSGEGTVDRKDGATRFTQIVLHPRLTLAPGADRARALRVLEKSEKACLISASLSAPVRLEPEIVSGWSCSFQERPLVQAGRFFSDRVAPQNLIRADCLVVLKVCG
jgi:uncharacterized OsmC-like protein